MDYKIIHDKLIEYARRTPARVRLKSRNTLDKRLTMERIYTEIHHIIPSSLGGKSCEDNLVELLPEEHLFMHMLRYKIYRHREDALAVRFMLNGFSNRPTLRITKTIITKKIRMGYAWIRSHAQGIRSTHGWHTPEGASRISRARRGTMPAKDAATGEMIGAVSVNHPNVLSGVWVHHAKGRKQSQKEIDFHKKDSLGQNNGNASGLSEEFFIQKGCEMFKEFSVILSWGYMLKLSEIRGFAWIKSLKSRFGGRGHAGYYQAVEERTGAVYCSYASRTFSKKNVKLTEK